MPLTLDTPNHGRAKTLQQTGRAIYMLGNATRPLLPYQVQRIEQRAIRKLRAAMQPEMFELLMGGGAPCLR